MAFAETRYARDQMYERYVGLGKSLIFQERKNFADRCNVELKSRSEITPLSVQGFSGGVFKFGESGVTAFLEKGEICLEFIYTPDPFSSEIIDMAAAIAILQTMEISR